MRPSIGRLFHFKGDSYALLEFIPGGGWLVSKLGMPSTRMVFSPETVEEVGREALARENGVARERENEK